MAITNSVSNSYTSGVVAALISAKGLSDFQKLAVALSGTAQQTSTLALPAAVTFSRGQIRIKFSSPGGANTTIAVVVTGTDGTNSTVLDTYPAAGFGTGVLWTNDYLTEFLSELNLNSFSVLTTLAGTTTTGTLDWEVVGDP